MEISLFSLNHFSSTSQAEPEQVLRDRLDLGFGMMRYTRQTLLDALASGERLKIKGVGICHFASDVSAGLANKAIKSFAFRGKLIASPEVKEVLLHKEA